MPASYPSSAKSFTNKTAGQAIDPNHVNDLQLEVAAIENDLVAGLPIARGGTGLTAALPDTHVPYSDGSAFTSSSNLTFDGSTLAIQGVVDVSGASAGQVKFPATQNASADANTLDDYEEGTWTPAFGGSGGQSGQAHSLQVGRYVKVGKLVTCYFQVRLSTLGTITTNAQIQGFPFTSENTADQRVPLIISYWNDLTTAAVFMGGFMEPNSTVANIYFTNASGTFLGNVQQANLSNTSQLIGMVTYVATS